MEALLYSVIEKQHLHELLETFYHCTGLPVQVLNENGEPLDFFGAVHPYCTIFKKHLPASENCAGVHAKASTLAMSLGEAYIFSCHSNLNHIVFPLANGNMLLGSILAGPFLMDAPDSLLLSQLAEKYRISTEDTLDMFEEATTIPVIEPAKVTHISRLLYYMCSGLVTDSRRQFAINKNRFRQQSDINESIQIYKAAAPEETAAYPYEKEVALIAKLKTRDIDQAKALLNDLLGYVFFSEGSNLDAVKSRAIVLSALLSRAAIEGGATSDTILRVNNQFLKELGSVTTMDDLCYKLQEVLDAFSECMLSASVPKSSETIRKALRYISVHFASEITLEEVAEQVGLNPSYFSTVFKQSTGSAFKDYVNMLRVEESKRLLAGTDYPIIDIALAAGFSDQSYFSKVFKKYTGFTPRQYR